MKRIYLLLAFMGGCALWAQAHEFWLQPDTFFAQPGQVVTIEVLVGEHFNGERSEGKKNRLIQYAHWTEGAKKDLSSSLTEDHYGTVPLNVTKPGTHLVAFANTNKYLSMRADSFLLYLREDGLDPIIKARQERRETQIRSREFYRRCVKTLIQVGPVKPTDKTFSLDTGMPLEIIPLQNPYTIKPGDWAQFQIVFDHKPLANALVRYWTRPFTKGQELPDSKPQGLTEEQQRSDTQGRIRFRLKTGQNMISLVQMVPVTDDKLADWQSYWGSLTFGCR
ncbi:DUF4198 domain-containing protein [Spirosoma pollinicola]|uniref:DUF4198 domain-containing protein n=1 Tax=Spirosoma pollinicola TaxID=2057025 RepID=A0A2K8Z9N8_9BACT|nr:DUF4198 domain-containing protein [Spirosoma pollinicola]AUD06582.1 DUF4198 domain-containing protein [Spirosoma pollinicola]